MGLVDSVKKYFTREQQGVYCQNCGNELTEKGGDVTNSGRIYCHGRAGVETSCLIPAMFNGKEQGIVFGNFYEPAQVQKAIRRGELIQFNPLEKAVEDALKTTPTN